MSPPAPCVHVEGQVVVTWGSFIETVEMIGGSYGVELPHLGTATRSCTREAGSIGELVAGAHGFAVLPRSVTRAHRVLACRELGAPAVRRFWCYWRPQIGSRELLVRECARTLTDAVTDAASG